ncbi:hypothetical protein IG631_23346 [Alternaria alternata]|nr:hypothetical protein IG631_23346 [Alternaria alternata]
MAAAAFGGRVVLSSLLAEFVDPSLPGPQRRLYRYQTYAEGRVMACRERCSLWQPGTNPLPEENNRLAARVALLESRLSLLDANNTVPTASYATSSSTGQQSNATDGQLGATLPGTRADSEYASLLDHYTLQSLTDIYFHHCHQHPYTYFHEGTFRQSLEMGILPSYLTLAIAAIAVSYSNELCFVGRQAEAMNCYSRLAWSQIMEQSFSDDHGPSVHTVQAANMLGIVDYIGK